MRPGERWALAKFLFLLLRRTNTAGNRHPPLSSTLSKTINGVNERMPQYIVSISEYKSASRPNRWLERAKYSKRLKANSANSQRILTPTESQERICTGIEEVSSMWSCFRGAGFEFSHKFLQDRNRSSNFYITFFI